MPATYEPIATTTLGSAASSITFSAISNTFTDLRVVLVFTPTSSLRSRIDFNSDTATNYSSTLLIGDGASALSSRYINNSYITTYNANNSTIAIQELDIFSYAGSTYKSVLAKTSTDANGSGLTVSAIGLYRSTSAISTIRLFTSASTYAAGTTATLYGIKAA